MNPAVGLFNRKNKIFFYTLKPDSLRIVILGAGNVATRLGILFQDCRHEVIQIFSRRKESALVLAQKLNSEACTNIADLRPDADILLCAVPDQVLPEILPQVPDHFETIVHTSGSMAMDILKPYCKSYGVLYPLQSLSAQIPIPGSEIPFLVEGSTPRQEKLLFELASQMSKNVRLCSSLERAQYHMLAVFCNNFSNYMMTIAADIAKKKDLEFDLMASLIRETSRKAIAHGPYNSQTGPARRNDRNILEKHMQMLQEFPDYQKLYTFVSLSIQELYNGNKVSE